MTNQDLSNTPWRKSHHSGNNGGECVEIANLGNLVAMRDSKDPDGPQLILSADTWRSLIAQARAGTYDA